MIVSPFGQQKYLATLTYSAKILAITNSSNMFHVKHRWKFSPAFPAHVHVHLFFYLFIYLFISLTVSKFSSKKEKNSFDACIRRSMLWWIGNLPIQNTSSVIIGAEFKMLSVILFILNERAKPILKFCTGSYRIK